MENEIFAVACANCVHLEKTVDKRNWVRYSCKYAPNIEWLGGFCREPLNSCCGKHKTKTISIKRFKKI